MDNLRLWGFSLIGICVFKLVMTLLVGVRPDPVNLTIALIALALGAVCLWLQARRSPRGETKAHTHHADRLPTQ